MFERQPWMQRAGEYPQSDQEYFALLARAVFSAGLGPKVVESRWNDMEQAFHGFAPGLVRLMAEDDVARLLSDPGIIRNRRKIEAVIKNAGTFLEELGQRRDAALATAAGPAGEGTGSEAAGAVPEAAPEAGTEAATSSRPAKRRGRAAAPAPGRNGHAEFHEYLLELGAAEDLDVTAESLAKVFAHLGRTSALFFLFSAGWRPRESGGFAAPANG